MLLPLCGSHPCSRGGNPLIRVVPPQLPHSPSPSPEPFRPIAPTSARAIAPAPTNTSTRTRTHACTRSAAGTAVLQFCASRVLSSVRCGSVVLCLPGVWLGGERKHRQTLSSLKDSPPRMASRGTVSSGNQGAPAGAMAGTAAAAPGAAEVPPDTDAFQVSRSNFSWTDPFGVSGGSSLPPLPPLTASAATGRPTWAPPPTAKSGQAAASGTADTPASWPRARDTHLDELAAGRLPWAGAYGGAGVHGGRPPPPPPPRAPWPPTPAVSVGQARREVGDTPMAWADARTAQSPGWSNGMSDSFAIRYGSVSALTAPWSAPNTSWAPPVRGAARCWGSDSIRGDSGDSSAWSLTLGRLPDGGPTSRSESRSPTPPSGSQTRKLVQELLEAPWLEAESPQAQKTAAAAAAASPVERGGTEGAPVARLCADVLPAGRSGRADPEPRSYASAALGRRLGEKPSNRAVMAPGPSQSSSSSGSPTTTAAASSRAAAAARPPQEAAAASKPPPISTGAKTHAVLEKKRARGICRFWPNCYRGEGRCRFFHPVDENAALEYILWWLRTYPALAGELDWQALPATLQQRLRTRLASDTTEQAPALQPSAAPASPPASKSVTEAGYAPAERDAPHPVASAAVNGHSPSAVPATDTAPFFTGAGDDSEHPEPPAPARSGIGNRPPAIDIGSRSGAASAGKRPAPLPTLLTSDAAVIAASTEDSGDVTPTTAPTLRANRCGDRDAATERRRRARGGRASPAKARASETVATVCGAGFRQATRHTLSVAAAAGQLALTASDRWAVLRLHGWEVDVRDAVVLAAISSGVAWCRAVQPGHRPPWTCAHAPSAMASDIPCGRIALEALRHPGAVSAAGFAAPPLLRLMHRGWCALICVRHRWRALPPCIHRQRMCWRCRLARCWAGVPALCSLPLIPRTWPDRRVIALAYAWTVCPVPRRMSLHTRSPSPTISAGRHGWLWISAALQLMQLYRATVCVLPFGLLLVLSATLALSTRRPSVSLSPRTAPRS